MQPVTFSPTENFTRQFEKLNPEQQAAVAAIEGPVMVNAGPGTGKTQILALRIANILLETDTHPGNILCLTYTDNGAIEMRNRLLKIIGPPAYAVKIHTFHSFCNEVIQDNLSFFGKQSLAPIGDLEEIALYYELIDQISMDNPLRRYRGDIYYDMGRLKHLFSLMKKEAWTPEHFNERIDSYLRELPVKEGFFYKRKHKEFKAGDPKVEAIRKETEHMELLRAAVNQYPVYNKMMAGLSRYNFDDMILWVLDAFEKNRNLLLDYQEKFLYILVDEFQDTSRSQNLLLNYLTAYWDLPNLFVVGDADQSIFSFQDASVENMLELRKKFGADLTMISLVNNYRSTQHILNVAHGLIRHNTVRTVAPEDDRPLSSANPLLREIPVEPVVARYANSGQEAIDVAIQIGQLVSQGISGKEIAVIYRNHSQVAELQAMLEEKHIAVNTKRRLDILQLPFIENIVRILAWINAETTAPYSGDELLFTILHSGFFRITPIAVARLVIAVNARKNAPKENAYSLRRMMDEASVPAPDLFNPPTGHSVKEISRVLEDLLQVAGESTLQQLLERVIQRAGVLSYVMQSPEKPWLMQVLNAFFTQLKDATHRDPELTLSQWLDDLALMKKNKLPVPLYKINASDNGVNMITAHGAKGSEFGYVFVIGCTQQIWDQKNSSGRGTFSLPDNLVANNQTATSLEESRRLFYVALTRAKTHLQVSWYEKDEKEKDQVKSNFITEMLESAGLQPLEKQVPDELVTEYLLLKFKEKARPEIELVEDEFISRLLKNYSLSITHLNNFLSCPLKFYYLNLLRVPAAKSESMSFGSAVHWALERLFVKMKENGSVFPGPETLVEDFRWHMTQNREAFTEEAFRRRLAYGEKILPAYYAFHIHRWNRTVLVELNLRNVLVQDVLLNGKLDKLEFTGRQVNVVDYKTGNVSNAKAKLLPPHAGEPNGGDYWRQAVFYKILLDHDGTRDWDVVSTEFDFIEPHKDEFTTKGVVIDAADVTTVTHQITDTWKKIQNRDFKTGCGKPDCEWCRFVKEHHVAVELHPAAEEEEAGNWPGSVEA